MIRIGTNGYKTEDVLTHTIPEVQVLLGYSA